MNKYVRSNNEFMQNNTHTQAVKHISLYVNKFNTEQSHMFFLRFLSLLGPISAGTRDAQEQQQEKQQHKDTP